MANGNKAKNSFGIPYLSRGNPFLVQFLNAILDALDQLRIQRSVDIDPLPTKDGVLLSLRNPTSAARRQQQLLPFAIIPVPDEDKVTIWPGDVEGIMPMIDGVFINDATAPQLTVVTGPIYFECTMDAAGVFTAVDIKNDATVPANTPTLRYRQIGTVSVVMGPPIVVTVTAQTVTTSVSHKLCAGLSTWGQA